jgi:5-deoxy-glucuronate isomerase
VLALRNGVAAQRSCGDREVCVVVVEGMASLRSEHGHWSDLGGRPDPWSGPPEAAYLPPGTSFEVSGDGEVALCWAPASGDGAPARPLPGAEIVVETRGYDAQERTIHPILMGEREAESLLVCEVLTPGGHWSSYPPHKHDRDQPPGETFLEETYYHRINPAQGFGLQRVYSEDRSLDETLAFGDRDCVLVPRGYHTVSAPPGYDLYYLNVMAGPVRLWAVANDPAHEWTLRSD